MLELILAGRQDEVDQRRAELDARARPDRYIVERLEALVSRAPSEHLSFDPITGRATLSGLSRRFDAGRFSVQSIGALRASARAQRTGQAGRARLSILAGADPLTDVGLLQATAAPGALFQVASQFNCLEAPDAMVVPIADYFRDPTQGPRASISAFPGTFVRHYAAPAADGTRFVQTQQRQLDLLAAALPSSVGSTAYGYLRSDDLTSVSEATAALEQHFEAIAVGLHDDVEVVLGANWGGAVAEHQRIAQVFTSTYAGGGYSHLPVEGDVVALCRVLLRAAYAGTLFAAASLGKRTVVLTLIGGGVFGNPHPLIWEAITWALEQTDELLHAPMHVVLNSREADQTIGPQRLLEAARERGGSVVRVDEGRVSVWR